MFLEIHSSLIKYFVRVLKFVSLEHRLVFSFVVKEFHRVKMDILVFHLNEPWGPAEIFPGRCKHLQAKLCYTTIIHLQIKSPGGGANAHLVSPSGTPMTWTMIKIRFYFSFLTVLKLFVVLFTKTPTWTFGANYLKIIKALLKIYN